MSKKDFQIVARTCGVQYAATLAAQHNVTLAQTQLWVRSL